MREQNFGYCNNLQSNKTSGVKKSRIVNNRIVLYTAFRGYSNKKLKDLNQLC